MEYVKIIGDNHQDALFKAKMQYGDTVIPVNHKTIKVGGLLGSNFFAKNAVELIAAIPERSRAKALTPDLLDEKEAKMALLKNPSEGNALKEKTDIHLKKVADKKFASPEDISLIKDNKSVKALQDLIQKKLMMENDSFQSTALHKTIYQGDEKKSLQEKRRPVMERNAPSRDFSTEDNMLYGSNGSAMGKIEKTLAEIQKSIDNLQIQNSFKNQKNFYETNLDFWQKKLLDADFSQDYVKLLLHDLKDQLSIAEQGDKNIVEKKLVQLLQKKIGITPPLLRSDEKRKVVMMIGATGVGKTTTMAKLGAI
jgi:flagellar biosynthesis GTPase FlhF